jgi:anti-sigma B factor antagonist
MNAFEVRVLSGSTVVVSGELDMATSAELSTVIEDVGVSGTVRVVVLDLARVTFLDSSGVRALLLAKAALSADGVKLVVDQASPQVATVFRIAGVEDEFLRQE